MKLRALVPTALAAAIAFAQPVAFLAQEAGRAADILAAARKAIGGSKLDAMKTFTVQSSVQRNAGSMQLNSDVEVVLDLPDKYLRSETPSGSGGGMMVMAGSGVSGFNGDRALQKLTGGSMSGGMVIRMGAAGPSFGDDNKEKPTPEQLEQMNRSLVRNGQIEASRMMLGWFATAHPAAHAEYTFAGEAESPDGKAYVIDVKNADSFAARLFIDEQTKLPLMVTYKGPQPRVMTAGGPGALQQTAQGSGGGHVMTRNLSDMSDEERKKALSEAEKQIQEMAKQAPVMVDFTIYFEEWREADGVKFPFRIRRASGGTTSEEWTVNKIKVNPKVDPKRFATPTT
jgi:hypothetical protein